jgi:RNA polymerase sigma factor for flagellar operon FliA
MTAEGTTTMIVSEPTKAARQPFSPKERERLILEHLNKVSVIARQLKRRLPMHVGLQDLISAGTAGLISAVDRFDPTRNARLGSFAELRIRGEMLDSLRRLDWAPRPQRQHAKRIEVAISVLEQRGRQVPTEEEIATELKLTINEYRKWQADLPGLNLLTLESVGSGDSERRDLIGRISGDPRQVPSAILERKELQHALATAISGLPDAEKTVLSLYYDDELTCTEIAPILGVHQSRVSQLRLQAILRLRVRMATLWPAHGQKLRVVAAKRRLAQHRPPRAHAASQEIPAATHDYAVWVTAAQGIVQHRPTV